MSAQAECQAQFAWMNNHLGQSPCLVGSFLEGACGQTWTVPPLPAGKIYGGPVVQGSTNQTSLCTCSSVTYNIVSACAACQSGPYSSWAVWDAQCPASLVGVGVFQATIPSGTAIPKWAYQDPTAQTDGTFNVNVAQALAAQGLPDSSTGSGSSSGSSKSGPPVGAIVGGAIGGSAVLLLLAFLLWYYLRLRHSSKASQAPSKQYISKWSKEVSRASADPASRSQGPQTSYSGSVAGDNPKDRELLMASADNTLPNVSSRYAQPQNPGRRSFSPQASTPPSSYPFPHAVPASNAASTGHSSSSRGRRAFGSSSHGGTITPFFLPPIDAPSTEEFAASVASPVGSTGNNTPYTPPEVPSPRRSSDHQRRPPAPILPSSIEYASSKRPPPLASLPIMQSAPQVSGPRASSEVSGRSGARSVHPPASESGGSAGGGGTAMAEAVHYNPDDPSTYPLTYYQTPSARHSQEQVPLGSSTFLPHTSSEKMPMAESAYAGYLRGPGLPYQHYVQNPNQNSRPSLEADANVGRAQSPNALPEYGPPGAGYGNLPLSAYDRKVLPQPPQTQASPQSPQAPAQPPYRAVPSRVSLRGVPIDWSPHARNQQEAEGEFDPWRGA